MTKRVNIYPSTPILSVIPIIRGVVKSATKDTDTIRKCIIARAKVEEILPDGTCIVLDLNNYNKDNTFKEEAPVETTPEAAAPETATEIPAEAETPVVDEIPTESTAEAKEEATEVESEVAPETATNIPAEVETPVVDETPTESVSDEVKEDAREAESDVAPAVESDEAESVEDQPILNTDDIKIGRYKRIIEKLL